MAVFDKKLPQANGHSSNEKHPGKDVQHPSWDSETMKKFKTIL
jgi:hypothetical protein